MTIYPVVKVDQKNNPLELGKNPARAFSFWNGRKKNPRMAIMDLAAGRQQK